MTIKEKTRQEECAGKDQDEEEDEPDEDVETAKPEKIGDASLNETEEEEGQEGDYKDTTTSIRSGTRPTSNRDSSRKPFPDACYCPITQSVFQDPVVTPDGDSYERAAYLVEHPDTVINTLYPNRALREIIQDLSTASDRSFVASMRRMDRSIRDGFNRMVSTSSLPADPYRPLPEAYYCNITFNLMHDPVIDPEGNTYERVAIENWIAVHGNSPLTRTALSSTGLLYPNKALAALLEEEKMRDEESIHPSIRRFNLETPPTASDPAVGGDLVAAAATANPQQQQQQQPSPQQQQMEHRQNQLCALWITICVLSLVIPYGMYILIAAAMLWICIKASQRNNNNNISS